MTFGQFHAVNRYNSATKTKKFTVHHFNQDNARIKYYLASTINLFHILIGLKCGTKRPIYGLKCQVFFDY